MPLQPVNDETRNKRLQLVDAALAQVEARGHYLTGCFGAMPGGADIVRRRQLRLGHDAGWDNLAIRAREHNAVGGRGTLRCSGRFGTGLGREIGRDRATQQRVRDYLAEYSSRDPSQWPLFDGAGYPRKAWDEFNSQDIYVLGEDCAGKPHFDCIGFINWVVTSVTGHTTTYSSSQWATSGVAPVSAVEGRPLERNLEPGDLLIRSEGRIPHIVMVGRDHELIEAAGIRVGVVRSRFDPSRFGHHSRLTNRFLGRE